MMKLSKYGKLGRHLLVVEMRIDGKEGNWFEVGWHNMCGELDANGSRKFLAPRHVAQTRSYVFLLLHVKS